MANKWYQNLNPFSSLREDSDSKALQEKLDMVSGEFRDSMNSEVKFIDSEPSGFNPNGSSDYSGIDQQIDIAALQRIYQTEVWVYNAVTALAEDIAALPVKLEKKQTVSKKIKNEITGAMEDVKEDVWVNASGEKLFRRFQYPNKYTTKTEFYMMLAIDLMTAGEYFIYLDAKDGVDLTTIAADTTDDNAESPFGRLRAALSSGDPIKGMYRLPPGLMKPVMSDDKTCVAGYSMQSEQGTYAYGFAEVIHVKLPNPLDPLRGLSPLVAAFKSVLLDRFSTEHMIRFYKSGARLGGVIETEKSLNKEQLARFQRSFESNYTGRQNHHRTLILPPGMAYKQIEQNPAETALLEFCKYNREAVLSAYKVPPIKVGIMDGANYANARVQLQTYFANSVKPKISFIEEGFNLKSALMPDSGVYRFKFDLSEVEELKEDLKQKADTGKTMIESGLSVNEVRQLLWKKDGVTGGDKVKAVEDMTNKPQGFPLTLSAPAGVSKDAPTSYDTVTAVEPTKVSLTERVRELVCQMVAAGTPIDQAVPKAMEQARLEGFTDDAEKLSTAENSAIVPTAVGTGEPKKPEDEKADEEKPCEKCGKSPCVCPPSGTPPADGKGTEQSLADFIATSLSKLSSDEPVTAEFIDELVSIYNEQHKELVDAKENEIADANASVTPDAATSTPDQIQDRAVVYGFGHTKDTIVAHWKSFIGKTDPMIQKRQSEVVKFFKEFERVLVSRLGGNIKKYGLHKARDTRDVEELLKLEAYDEVIKRYIADIDQALLEAYEYGFTDTLATFKFGPPSEVAKEFLKQFGAKEVTLITDTTREQMKDVLTEAFEEGVAMNEVTMRLREKFGEIAEGRAATIARTETLTAVSEGREQKRQEWQEQFPEEKLQKMWVSAQDDRVRDSHAAVDGEVADADAEFSNGLKYPREAGGEASEVINCRCTDITFAAKDSQQIQDTLPADDEGDTEKSFLGEAAKGGAGSGCRGDNCGRPPGGATKPYERPAKGERLAPKDITKVERTNGLLEDRFNKAGSQVNDQDAVAFSYTMMPAYRELKTSVEKIADSASSQGLEVTVDKPRLKSPASLKAKMNGKWSGKTLDQVTDGVGARLVVRDLHDMDALTAKLQNMDHGLKIIEQKDFTREPHDNGYRAMHLLVKTPSGKIGEIQIKTERQQLFSKWSHSSIYKNQNNPKLRDNKEVKAYTSKIGDILHQMDLGQGRAAELPEPPKAVKDAGIPAFPWGKAGR